MTETQALETVYSLLLGTNSIYVRIRSGEGLDQTQFDALRSAMLVLIDAYETRDLVPKKLALCFVDILNNFYSTDKYEGEESDRIEDSILEISKLAEELLES